MVDSQRRLYSLGLFNEVNMAVQNPEGLEPSKDVLFNLQEAKRWTFRYGGGIEFATGNIPTTTNPQGATGVSPNGVLEITRLNMFGRDQTFSIRGRYGLLTRRGLVTYDAPRLFHRENWRIIVSALYDNTADVNTFASERLEGAVQAEQRYNRFTTFLYGLTFQRVAIDPNSLVIDPTLITLYSNPVFIAMPTFTMVRDRRDDPINPTQRLLQRAEPWPRDQRAGIADQLRTRAVRQLDLLHLQEELGVRPQDTDRNREALWHERFHRASCRQTPSR